MRLALVLLGTLLIALARPAQAESLRVPRPDAQVPVRFSLIKTSEVTTLESFAYDGGDWFKRTTMNHVAVLVQHPRGSFLFDTGLGRRIDAQFHLDMPWWGKLLFAYGPVRPARDQLDAAAIPPVRQVIPSHAHWDHASGLVDFPEAEVWLTTAEKAFIDAPPPAAVLPSQVQGAAIRWQSLAFAPRPFAGYAESHDLYGDGSVVLVPLSGHTPGSVGMFVNLPSGRQVFFVGDLVWKLEAARRVQAKYWVARNVVDHDPAETLGGISTLNALMRANPDLVVVPAHDAGVQDALGYFPNWVD